MASPLLIAGWWRVRGVTLSSKIKPKNSTNEMMTRITDIAQAASMIYTTRLLAAMSLVGEHSVRMLSIDVVRTCVKYSYAQNREIYDKLQLLLIVYAQDCVAVPK